jgi:hypothetical protein
MPQRFAAEKTKLGRNDLCSCGSGKKYKHCCLTNTVSADAFWSNVNSQNQELTKLLMAFAIERCAPDLEDAWEDFHFGVNGLRLWPRKRHSDHLYALFSVSLA